MYFPTVEITWGDFTIDHLAVDSVRTGESKAWRAHLNIATASGKETIFDCRNVTVSPAEIHAECGVVRIDGEFVDRGGRFGTRAEIVPQQTPVVKAKVSIVDGQRALRSWDSTFTYWAGD